MAELQSYNGVRIGIFRSKEFPRATGRGFVKPRRTAG